MCFNCSAGFYSSAEGVADVSGCNACPPGKYSSEVGNIDAKKCEKCSRDMYSAVSNMTVCRSCPSGYYVSIEGQTTCGICEAGKQISGETGSRVCESCTMGKISSAGGNCTNCTTGSFSNSHKTVCELCPEGKWSDNVGAPSISSCRNCSEGSYSTAKGAADESVCALCSAGRFQSSTGASAECTSCPKGFYQEEAGAAFCHLKPVGMIVLGGAAAVKVPLGSFVQCNGSCSFEACAAGTYGEDPPTQQCHDCPAGWSSYDSAVECTPCGKGTFSERNRSLCASCPSGFFQPQNAKASTECFMCPAGYVQEKTGESACVSLNWVHAEDCTSEQFLNDTGNRTSWKCEPCLEGASCAGAVTWRNLPNIFGWWKIPRNERNQQVFAPCLYPPACPGGPNPSLSGNYIDTKGKDLSKKNATGCAFDLGFRNASRLCHTCAKNHRRRGAHECAKCPTREQNWGLIALGLLLIFCMLVYVVHTTLSEGETVGVSQSVKKIMLNYLQVIALARSFPLRWNGVLRTLFEIQGAISTLGDHIVNVDCISTSKSAAELFYGKQVTYACTPLITGCLGFVFWFVYGLFRDVPFFAKRTDRKVRTPKDKFIVTVTAIVFLMYPTMCGQAFGLFSCKVVGNQAYLQVDLEEPCYKARHLLVVLLLGLPQLLFYVLGLPLLVLKFLHRNRSGLFNDQVVLNRWGLFFKGYRGNRYYWEIVISARKVGVVALSVFGRELGVGRQSLVALLLLLACVVLEVVGRPFREVTKSHSVLKHLELSALIVEFGTLWSGLMIFQSGPKSEGVGILLTIFVVGANVGLMLWFLYVLGKASTTLLKRLKSGMNFRISRPSIGRRKFDSQGSRSMPGNFDGVVKNQAIASKVVELASILGAPWRQQGGKKQTLEASTDSTRHEHSDMEKHWTRHYDNAHSCYYLHNERTGESRWEGTEDTTERTLVETNIVQSAAPQSVVSSRKQFWRYETEEGVNYYVPELGGEAVWHLPENAELVA